MSYRDFKDRWDISSVGNATASHKLIFIEAKEYFRMNLGETQNTEDAKFEIIEPLQLLNSEEINTDKI